VTNWAGLRIAGPVVWLPVAERYRRRPTRPVTSLAWSTVEPTTDRAVVNARVGGVAAVDRALPRHRAASARAWLSGPRLPRALAFHYGRQSAGGRSALSRRSCSPVLLWMSARRPIRVLPTARRRLLWTISGARRRAVRACQSDATVARMAASSRSGKVWQLAKTTRRSLEHVHRHDPRSSHGCARSQPSIRHHRAHQPIIESKTPMPPGPWARSPGQKRRRRT
jgi:hypothetical protein